MKLLGFDKNKYLFLIIFIFISLYAHTIYNIIQSKSFFTESQEKVIIIYKGTPTKIEDKGSCCFNITSVFNGVSYQRSIEKEDALQLELNKYNEISKKTIVHSDTLLYNLYKVFILIAGTTISILSFIILITYLVIPDSKSVRRELELNLENEFLVITCLLIPIVLFLVISVIFILDAIIK